MLLALDHVKHEFDLRLHAAHLDHGLRGEESRADRRFVEQLCARIGLPLAAARWNARARMKRLGLGGEAGLRALRRSYLESTARRVGARAIATAHTADDQLETVVMRLLRGTGHPGLGGMSPRAGRWIKPLLQGARQEVMGDLETAGQSWREDSSNRDLGYTRNRVRHDLVPAMVRVLANGSEGMRAHALLVRRVARAAAEVRETRRTIEHAASRLLDVHGRFGTDGWTLSGRALAGHSPAVVRAVFRRCWVRLRGGDTGLTHRHLESLEQLVSGARMGARVLLPEDIEAVRDHDTVRIGRPLPVPASQPFQVRVPGEVSWRRRIVQSTWISKAAAVGGLMKKSQSVEFFAADGLEGDLELRDAQADEWFVPFGGRRRVRIAEFLSKQRVSREFRSRPTVLADAGGILWVIGVRRSARAPVMPGTRRVLRVFAENHD
jgi:tRNA(Ile)-lysidine synthase